MLLSISGLDFVTSISGAASSISNVGPGLGEIIGPDGNYKSLPDLSKWILAIWYAAWKIRIICSSCAFLSIFLEKLNYGNYKKNKVLAETFSVYFDRRMIKILLLGAISGFPWVIIGSSSKSLVAGRWFK